MHYRLEKTLPTTIKAVEENRRTVASTLGEVNNVLRLRESNDSETTF